MGLEMRRCWNWEGWRTEWLDMHVLWEIDLEMMIVHVKNDSKLGRLTQLF